MILTKVSDCEHLHYQQCEAFNRKNPNCTNACPLYEPESPTNKIIKPFPADAKQLARRQLLKSIKKESE